MNQWDVKKIITTLFLAGFLGGIVFANIFVKEYILSMSMFQEYYLEQYSNIDLNMNDYIWYIIKIRITPFVFLIIAGCTKYKKIISSLYIVWTGFSFGLILTAAIMRLKMKGIIFCFANVMPHFICYIAGYVMLFVYYMVYPANRWNGTKTFCFILFIILGIVTECYINPGFMELVTSKI